MNSLESTVRRAKEEFYENRKNLLNDVVGGETIRRFKNMSRSALHQHINGLIDRKENLVVKITTSCGSDDELRSLGETLKTIKEELEEAESALAEKEEEPDPAEENNRSLRNAQVLGAYNMSVPGNADGGSSSEKRTVASFSVNRAATPSITDVALRSDETLVSRMADARPLDLGKYVRGMVTGSWNDAVEERAAFTTSAAGVIIPEILSAQIIDMARNVSLFTSASVPLVPMEEGNLTIARVVKDPEFKFKPEGAEQPEGNNFELDGIQLNAKTCYGYAYVTLEAIHSAKNLSQILTQVFSQAMANAIDEGMLYGQETDLTAAPAGIMNDAAINTLAATNTGYVDYVKAIGAIRRANGTPSVLGINADTEEFLALKVDSTGQPLNPPASFDALTRIVSNQLRSDATAGSDALVFDPQAMVIGVQNKLTLKMIDGSDECIKKGLVAFQIYSMVDSIVVRPTHITKITGIKELPAV